MSKRLDKKNEKLKLIRFQQKMIKAAYLGFSSFYFNGKTYILSCSGNLAQTLIDDRILYRISIKQKPKKKNMELAYLQHFI